MQSLPANEFERLVAEAIDALPKIHIEHLSNVGFVIENEPTELQRQKLKLRSSETLFGLYEGIPLTKRGSNYSLVLPDKITIFKLPAEAASRDISQLRTNLKRTVWHEVGHYYGLSDADIHAIEAKHNL